MIQKITETRDQGKAINKIPLNPQITHRPNQKVIKKKDQKENFSRRSKRGRDPVNRIAEIRANALQKEPVKKDRQ